MSLRFPPLPFSLAGILVPHRLPPELAGFHAAVLAAPGVAVAAAAAAAAVVVAAGAAAVAAAEAAPLVTKASGLPSSFTDLSWNRGGKESELGDKSKLAQGAHCLAME